MGKSPGKGEGKRKREKKRLNEQGQKEEKEPVFKQQIPGLLNRNLQRDPKRPVKPSNTGGSRSEYTEDEKLGNFKYDFEIVFEFLSERHADLLRDEPNKCA